VPSARACSSRRASDVRSSRSASSVSLRAKGRLCVKYARRIRPAALRAHGMRDIVCLRDCGALELELRVLALQTLNFVRRGAPLVVRGLELLLDEHRRVLQLADSLVASVDVAAPLVGVVDETRLQQNQTVAICMNAPR
jgi:hypothetical protein